MQADFEQYTGFWIDEKENTRLDLREKAEQIAERVKGQRGIVSEIVKEEKRQLPPLLYDLTELQRECNRKFGFSAKKTLDIAPVSYTHLWVSLCTLSTLTPSKTDISS